MSKINSFADLELVVRNFVYKHSESAVYSLDRIQKILKELGDPQEKFKTIHIAGTSGKTSTAYYIAAMLDKAGYSVGLSVSPHIEKVSERAQLNLNSLPEKEFCQEFSECVKAIESFRVKPTYFELFVAFAFWLFAKRKVDYAVIEVGLGGLLDATNAVNRKDKICVITDIGFDHTKILGETLGEITRQKAGIIHPNNQVFMLDQPQEISGLIKQISKKNNAQLIIFKNAFSYLSDNLPEFQRRNWSLAKQVCASIFQTSGINLSDAQWIETTKINIPGRFEELNYNGKKIILDGAHNNQKMSYLIKSLKNKYPNKKLAFLIALATHKKSHLNEITGLIDKTANHVIITSFNASQDSSHKSLAPDNIETKLQFVESEIELELDRALNKLLARDEDILVVTGSLYLIGAVKKLL